MHAQLYCFGVPTCNDFYVKTPNNSNVKACNQTSSTMPDWAVNDADTKTRPYAIYVHENGTRTYNCHGYAWNLKEGGNKVWINNLCHEAGNLNQYWNDNSYLLLNKNPHKPNMKVFYGSTYQSDDHSAITTENPNYFISKMGAGVLATHLWNNSPYDHSDLKYYARSFIVCSGTPQTITAGNWPSGYYWDKSSNLTLTSTSTDTTTVKANSSGAGWVKIKDSSGATKATYDVWVGAPNSANFYLSGSIGNYGYITDVINVCSGEYLLLSPWLPQHVEEGILEYQFQNTGSFGFFSYNDHGVVTFVASTTVGSTFTIQYRRRNACDWSSWYTIYGSVENCPWKSPGNKNKFIAYPNPTGDVLNVEIDSEKIIQSKTAIIYDIRLLDGLGNLLRYAKTKGEKVEFNVGNLPVGVYYLHIFDGANEKPEMHPVVIER